MQKVIAVVAGIGVACMVSGCVLVPIALVGGGVIGGIAISEDTVQTDFDESYDEVWNAALGVVDELGKVEIKDEDVGRIQGYVPKSKVTVQLQQLTPSTVRVHVKARKTAGVVPDIKTSHRVAHGIAEALEETASSEEGSVGEE
jgi:hypothetical protein